MKMRTTHASTKCLTGNDCAIDSKLGLLELGLRLYLQVFDNSQRHLTLDKHLNVYLAGLLNLSQLMNDIENWKFAILQLFLEQITLVRYYLASLRFFPIYCNIFQVINQG